jgi:hypothetical protein
MMMRCDEPRTERSGAAAERDKPVPNRCIHENIDDLFARRRHNPNARQDYNHPEIFKKN